MDLCLKEKIIVVTDGAKDVGKGIVQVLAKEGAYPAIVGRNEKDNKQVVIEVEASGSRVDHVVAELTKPEQCTAAVATIAERHGQGGTSAYAASNGGRNALTHERAVELRHYGIWVNAVIVGDCWTPLYDHWIRTFPNPEEKLDSILSVTPFGKRMTTVGELGNAVAFLLSPRSSHTAGQLIHVDGGNVHLDCSIR